MAPKLGLVDESDTAPFLPPPNLVDRAEFLVPNPELPDWVFESGSALESVLGSVVGSVSGFGSIPALVSVPVFEPDPTSDGASVFDLGLELVPPKLEAEFLALPNMEPGFDRELEGRFLEFVSAKLEPEFLLDPNSERGFAAGGFFVEPDLDSDLAPDLAPDLEALLAPVPNGELGFDVEPELVVVPGFDVDDDLDVEPGLIFELDPKEELPEGFVAPTLDG